MGDTRAERGHLVKITIDQGAYPTIICPFDPSDESRPCWPYDEQGQRMGHQAGAGVGCVYRDWIENDGIDAVTNTAVVTFQLASAEWVDGFAFQIGEQVPNAE